MAALLAALALGSCSSPTEGPDPSAPASVAVEPATALLVSVGDTVELSATVRNGSSQPISTAVSWSSGASGVATVDGSGRVVAVKNGMATITATAGGVTGTATVTVEQVVDSTVASGDTQAADIGSPLDSAVVVTLLDARDNPVVGAPVSFTVASGGGAVTPASSTTDATGSTDATWTLGTSVGIQELDVEAGFSGEATLRYTANGYPLEARSLVVHSGDGQTELPSELLAVPLRVQALDSLGNGVPDVLVTFSVDGDAVLEATEVPTDLDGIASVGLTLGSALGAYTVTASVPDSLTATGRPLAGSPVELGAEAVAYTLSPVPSLVVGDTVTLSGSGFHPTLESNEVLLGGVAAKIVEGSQTELAIEVPGFGCTPERGHELHLSRAGHQAARAVTVTPAGALDLAVGERRIVSEADGFCLQLRSGTDEEYLVGLTSTSWFDGGASFSMVGVDSTGPFPALTPVRGLDGGTTSGTTSGGTLWRDAPGSGDMEIRSTPPADSEMRLRAWESERVSGMAARDVEGVSSPSLSDDPAAAPPAEGEVLQLRLPDLTGDACIDYVPLTAEVFSVGARLALATTEPLPSPLDPARAVLIAAADALHAAFGDVAVDWIMDLLGAPAGWDGTSHVTVVLTHEVSGMGLPVYASAVDQLPRSVCPSSDEGNYVYAAVPVAATVSQLSTALSDAPPELAHQIAHVVQWARRLADGGNLLPSWLAEGQAELIVEHVGLELAGLGSQQDLGSEVLSMPAASAWIPERFDRLALFQGWDGGSGTVAGAPEQCSLFGFAGATTVCDPEAAPGAAWAFVRYLSDRFGAGALGGEAAMHQAIVDLEPTGDLVGQVEDLLGVGLPELLVDWAATLYTDGRLTPGEAPTLQMTSWVLTEMFPSGPKRLTPETFGFTDFTRTGSIVGGGTAYTLVTSGGAHGSLALAVDDGAGGAIPEVMRPRLWVVRMR